jgi:hypothetical protein
MNFPKKKNKKTIQTPPFPCDVTIGYDEGVAFKPKFNNDFIIHVHHHLVKRSKTHKKNI